MSEHFQPETMALHTGIHRSQFNEHSEALYLTSSFVFDSAAQAAARFLVANQATFIRVLLILP